ncbi:SGNH/GDSL hydrolase family protein [Dyella subtropica]|uniref:SGNH/GDSL hydrolase family protein n=1 Tax=Dyella subtropica TaxID=2992127 RepID=UPI002257FC73|nr:SGNH/GDSL hydrolase family protein [Dyella subtropica]
MLRSHPLSRSCRSIQAIHPGLSAMLFLVAMLAMPLHAATSRAVREHDEAHWVATWMASPQPRWDGDFALPVNLPSSLWNQTVRQSARVSVGGGRVRVVLSNAYGTRPLVIGAAHIALAGAKAATVAGSDRALTFNGQSAITIPPGAPMISDPVDLNVAALGSVTVSLFLPEPTAPATFHWDARQTTYIAAGNQVGASTLNVDSMLTSRVFLSAILVEDPAKARTVVALGDSITDGNGATMDANTRWPDFLARRLAGQHVAVLNAGISGARVLSDKMGVNALARFERDVLDQPGIASVVVLMGINDISWNGTPLGPQDEVTPAEAMIAGYRQLIARAHVHGVRIVGATLTPFEGALQDTPMKGYYRADKERVRQAVNRWIRESGEFDAVVDFDAVLRDPAHPQRFLPAYDSGDHLHPGDLGNQAMAEAIDAQALLGSH